MTGLGLVLKTLNLYAFRLRSRRPSWS